MVCTTVTNNLVQNAISTLPARADGAAAGSGQQGRSSSEGRGAVVQDAEGSKQQRAGRAWLKRLPRHARLGPSSDRTWPPGIPPLLWAHVPSLGVAPSTGWIAATSKCALGMPMASLVVPGVAGAEDSQLGQQATLPCAQPWSCPSCQPLALPEWEGYVPKQTEG